MLKLNWKRFSIQAVALLIMLLLPVAVFAAQPSDVATHWAKAQITDWANKGLVKSYPDGSFKPDNNISRAEFMALVNGAFGYKDKAVIDYKDVSADKWFADTVAVAKAAGYITGYSDGTMKPNNYITRQEAAIIIMKIKKLQENATGADSFGDAAGIPGWSKGAVGAVASANIMGGYPDGTFKAVNLITRAEAVVALNKALPAPPVTPPVTPPASGGPALAGVTIDNAANTVSGMDATMEFSTNGTNWTVYDAVTPNLPDLTGTLALQVRVAATATHEAGAATTFNFTLGGTAPVNLGTAGNYAILAKTGISSVPDSVITGNIGVSPIDFTAITGFSLTADATNLFSTSAQITGKAYASDYAVPTPSNLTTAISNMETAYTDAAGRAVNYTELYGGDISGKTLTAGVYKWGTGVLINTNVTLNAGADDVWIFQIAEGITQASNTRIILTGGAQAKNIFWQAAETVAIGTDAHFEGIILGMTNITLGTNASINGRLLAQTAVTLDKSIVVAP